MSFTLTSPAFTHGDSIPRHHTCEGADVSPELEWSSTPDGTHSFALILGDPDSPDPSAPQRTYIHWILYNIPGDVRRLSEGMTSATLPPGAQEGLNDWQRPGYGGPCPRIGRHRYLFTLYALDVILPNLGAAPKAQVENAMAGHILGEATLMGTYQKVGTM